MFYLCIVIHEKNINKMAWTTSRTRKNKWGQTEYYENLGGLSDGRWTKSPPSGWKPGPHDYDYKTKEEEHASGLVTNGQILAGIVIVLLCTAGLILLIIKTRG